MSPVSSKPNSRMSGFIWASGRLSPSNPLERNAQTPACRPRLQGHRGGEVGRGGCLSWFHRDCEGSPTLQTARDACERAAGGGQAAESKRALGKPNGGSRKKGQSPPLAGHSRLSFWTHVPGEHLLRLQLTAQEAQHSDSSRTQSRPRGPPSSQSQSAPPPSCKSGDVPLSSAMASGSS